MSHGNHFRQSDYSVWCPVLHRLSLAGTTQTQPLSAIPLHDAGLIWIHSAHLRRANFPKIGAIRFIPAVNGPATRIRPDMLTIHHLGISQCERVLWLCEELAIDYKLIKHTRDPLLSPQSLKDVPGNELGQSPFIEDDDVTLSESAACVDFIIAKYGNGRLQLKLGDEHYADYLQFYHYSNGTLQPAMIDHQLADISGVAKDNIMYKFAHDRLEQRLSWIDKQLSKNKYLAGPDLTAADIMTVYTLTTQRYWGAQADLTPYTNILRYLQDISKREAYQRAMQKGDPEMHLLLDGKPPEKGMFEAGGVPSDIWRKK